MRRLNRYVPIFMIALMVQLLLHWRDWEFASAVSDPLAAAEICLSHSSPHAGDQGGQHRAHDASCVLCCAFSAATAASAHRSQQPAPLASSSSRSSGGMSSATGGFPHRLQRKSARTTVHFLTGSSRRAVRSPASSCVSISSRSLSRRQESSDVDVMCPLRSKRDRYRNGVIAPFDGALRPDQRQHSAVGVGRRSEGSRQARPQIL